MSTTRTTRQPVAAIAITEDQMRAALEKYVAAKCEIDKISAIAKADVEAIKARVTVESAPHEAQLKVHQAIVVTYIEQNRQAFCAPHPRKREVYGGHKIGLQTGAPSVQLIKPTGEKGRQTEEGFIMACNASDDVLAHSFIRKIEEMDKDSILGSRRSIELAHDDDADGLAAELEQFDSKLAALGARVTQGEKAVIDLNLQPSTAS